jgi:hypothetical protein
VATFLIVYDNRLMDEPLPFTALLSFALVAFTIEADNAVESQTPHRTTRQGEKLRGVRAMADLDGDMAELPEAPAG